MLSRREVLKLISAAGVATLAAGGDAAHAQTGADKWVMPDEAERHKRTWMAFGASAKIWGNKLLPEVQRNLALIANTISEFEPVTMLVRGTELSLAKRMLSSKVETVACPLDDLWIRDTGPVFVINKARDATTRKACVDFNFNGWGEKQAFAQDALVAQFIAKQAEVNVRATRLVLEGGGIEVDGQGSAVISESCVLIDNRNPGLTKAQCERALLELIGVTKVIWIPGVKGKDITDGHTDFYARFARPGVVVAGYDADAGSFDHAVTKRNIEVLRQATDARGKALEVITLTAPQSVRKAFESNEFAAGYVGFYVCNGAVVAQEFGDKRADRSARDTLTRAFPGRKIIQLNVDGIAAGGGSIHCATQQEPL